MENTMNNDVNTTANLSEADKIFIPKDLDNDGVLSDYTEYKVGFYRTVPPKCVLVRQNRITKLLSNMGGPGIKFMPPFITKSILVSTVDRTIDYNKISYLTHDGIMANIDIAIIVKISDPVKYIEEGKHQIDQLSVLINKLLRAYVANREYDELSKGTCRLDAFDPDGELIEFEQRYGIKINKAIFKEVALPANLQQEYDNRKTEEERRKAQQVRLQAQTDKAQTDAEITRITAQAKAEEIRMLEEAKARVYLKKMEQLVQTLIENGVPKEGIADYLKTQIASEHGNAIFMGGNDRSSEIAKGVAAGNTASTRMSTQESTTVKKPSNSERLLESLNAMQLMGITPDDNFLRLQKELSTESSMKTAIDNLSEEDYQRTITPILNSYQLNKTTQEETHQGRTR